MNAWIAMVWVAWLTLLTLGIVGLFLRERRLKAQLEHRNAEHAELFHVKQQLENQLRAALEATAPKVTNTCESCVHWDHEAGQAAMNQNLAFKRAAEVLTPFQMGSQVEYDAAGQALPRRDGRRSRMASSWADLGQCNLRSEGTFKGFTCPNYHHLDAPVPEGGFADPVPLEAPKPSAPHVPTERILERMEADRRGRSMQGALAADLAPVPSTVTVVQADAPLTTYADPSVPPEKLCDQCGGTEAESGSNEDRKLCFACRRENELDAERGLQN